MFPRLPGISLADAQKYIEAGGNKVKTACVMAVKNVSREEAEKLLEANGGILRKVLQVR